VIQVFASYEPMNAFCCLTLLLALLGGCTTAPDAVIREIHLFGVPVALDLDQNSGPDGFAVRVYASNGREATGVPIKNGRLEINLYDGGKAKINADSNKPIRVWTYDAQNLKTYAAKSSMGWGYRFAPAWGEARPTRDRFTVVVRYVAPTGEVISSSPSIISMTVQ